MNTSKVRPVLAGIAALALLTVASPARADHHAVKIAKNEKIGNYLADAKGSTLYVFKKDSPGKSACTADCLAKWPVYYAEAVAPTGGLDPKSFGTITREDGKKQTTYKGMPLYYFAGDKAPGDSAGQGIKDVWYAATP